MLIPRIAAEFESIYDPIDQLRSNDYALEKRIDSLARLEIELREREYQNRPLWKKILGRKP